MENTIRRVVFLSIIIVLLFSSTVICNAAEVSSSDVGIEIENIVGDVNGDGDISIDDATLIQKHIVQLDMQNYFYKYYADFDYDGKISIDDVTLIQMYIAGKITIYNNAYYCQSAENYTLYKYIGKEKYITLPSKIKNKAVTTITSYAFLDNNTLVQITLPKSYERIEDNAFVNCSELMSIIIINNKLSYGNSFIDCNKLKNITFK